jgi:hypothetical protein
MAGDIPDLEKQEQSVPPIHNPSTLQHNSSAKKEDASNVSHSDSSSSTDTDPLSPLQHALSRPISAAAAIELELEIETAPPLPPDDDDHHADSEDGHDDHDGPANNNKLDLDLTRTRTSLASVASRLPEFEVTFEPDDPENPKNWLAALLSFPFFLSILSLFVFLPSPISYYSSPSSLIPKPVDRKDLPAVIPTKLQIIPY